MTAVLSRPPLSATDLVALTRFYAAEARSGRLGPLGPDSPDVAAERWHRRVHATADVDVWVISWLPTQGTELHDHGGSTGAFTVLTGELTEAVWSGSAGLVDRRHRARTDVTFGSGRVHDVRNTSDEPAFSVHAYSPPLTRMTFYDVVDRSLRPTSVLATTDPEPVR